MPLYAGVCETNITPPPGVWLCGYAFRPSGALGVHDDLYARAVVFTDGEASAAVLATDLLGLEFSLVEQVRGEVAEQTGIAPEALMLNSTHTHAGPNVREFNTMGTCDPAYMDVLARKLVGVVRQASEQMRPVSISHGRAPVQVGVNRRQTAAGRPTIIGRNLAGPVAPYVDVLVVADLRARPTAVLFSHACHLTTLGGDNLQITAEFGGRACGHVREQLGHSVTPLFLQGCAGNINPMDRGTFAAVERNGDMLGDAVIEAVEEADPLDGEDIGFDERVVSLPLLPPPPRDRCADAVAEWTARLQEAKTAGDRGAIMHAEGMRDYAEQELALATNPPARLEQPFAIQRLRVGGAQLIGLPAEAFVQYALDFARQAEEPTFVLGYTNGVHGYLPTAADYAYGGYEVEAAHRYYGSLMFAPESEKIVRAAAYDLLGVTDPDWSPYPV